MKRILQLVCIAFITSPVFAQWTDQNSGIGNDLEAVHFISEQEGWAVGRQGKIIHTTNAGATWTQQNSSTTNDLNKVYMVNSTFGMAVGDGGKVVRYNGSSWTTISIGFSQDMYGIFFTDMNTGWISGEWGRIMRTTDGGATWSVQMDNSTYSNTFRDLFMLSESEGWAVGSNGIILRYNGSNWVASPNNPAYGNQTMLHSVSFSSSTNGFVTGDGSKVYRFDGSGWSEYGTNLADNTYHITGVQTLSENLAYAATSPGFGGQGIILKFDGNVWAIDYEYTGMNTELFSGISFPSAGKGYAVGAGGMIKTKGTGGGGPTSVQDFASPVQLNAFPNPFMGPIAFTYTLATPGDVQIRIYDSAGVEVSSMYPGMQPAGEHFIQYDGTMLAPGVYYVKLNAGPSTTTLEIIK